MMSDEQAVPTVWQRPGIGTKLGYAIPYFAVGAMGAPIALELKIFYTDTLLVPAGLLALAIACARVFDAITDPVMGWISDQTRTRWGRRKPWLVLGVPFSALFFWLMFAPPRGLTADNGVVLWGGAMFCLYYLFHTIWNVPYQGLGLELSPDYQDRNRLFGLRAFVAFLGLTGSFFLIFTIKARGVFADERQTIAILTGLMALLSVALFIVPLFKVQENPEFSKQDRIPLIPGVRRALRNRPFRLVLFTYIIATVANSMPPLIMPYFSKYVLILDDQWRAIFGGVYTMAGFLSIPLWLIVSRFMDKHRIWLISSIIGVLSGFLLFTVGEGQIPRMIILEAFRGMAVGALFIMYPAILADVVDYDELRTGQRREAQFTAFSGLIPKFVSIIAAALPLAVLGAVGYDPSMTSLSPDSVLTIRILFALVPIGFHVVVFVIILRYPISRQVHQDIRNSIQEHQQGREAQDPISGRKLVALSAKTVDEDTGWFLDNFSRNELSRMAAEGQKGLVSRVSGKFASYALVCLGLIVVAIWLLHGSLTVSQTDQMNQGLAACMVIAAGLVLTVTLFHLVRIFAAKRMTEKPVDRAIIQNHLEKL
ncbi:MAG: hypothetical protein GY846_12620 [Deltaproteobacteria bacterium]|nr:hypothetical protein [Deltaproteobacteria bacterium]